MKQLETLRSLINKYNEAYYNQNISLISDQEYDELLKQLNDLETKLEVKKTEQIGAPLKQSSFKKTKHKIKMLSLANSYSTSDLMDFDNRVKKTITEDKEYILELKLDGLSIALHYEAGILKQALTRGDGEVGEDVTENIKQITSIPLELKEKIDLEVRGEVIMPISIFNNQNAKRTKEGKEPFANPRNAASGTLRQLDPIKVKERGLDCYLYHLVSCDKEQNTHLDSIKIIKDLGFKTTEVFEEFKSMELLTKRIEHWNKERHNLNYETDGLVIKINSLKQQEELGTRTKVPKWAMAYKFKAEEVETKLLGITFQVGRTGTITPVAELEEVTLAGTKVRRASLHNFDEIKRKDIRVFDFVTIIKAAEIIPQVLKVNKKKRKGNEVKITEPKTCPVCNGKVGKVEGEVALKCFSETCPAKLQRQLEYFVGRDAMNIDNLGPKVIEQLLANNLIDSCYSIYDLHKKKEELLKLERMGEKSVQNMLDSIEKSKERPFAKVLYSLGIKYIGRTATKLLLEKYKSIDELTKATKEELESIEGFGNKMAESLVNYLSKKENLHLIKELKSKGLNFKEEQIEKKQTNNILTGKKILFTGKLKHYKRNEIKELIEELGGTNANSVSKTLDLLIVGEKAGSKLQKANELNIKVLTEEEFIKLIKGE